MKRPTYLGYVVTDGAYTLFGSSHNPPPWPHLPPSREASRCVGIQVNKDKGPEWMEAGEREGRERILLYCEQNHVVHDFNKWLNLCKCILELLLECSLKGSRYLKWRWLLWGTPHEMEILKQINKWKAFFLLKSTFKAMPHFVCRRRVATDFWLTSFNFLFYN